jgi:hypothetical protein
MSRDDAVTTYPRVAESELHEPEFTPRPHFGGVAESSPVREIVDVAMVGLIGGGPRLAIRAAKVFLEDSYASRVSERQGRLSRRGGRRRR